MATVWAKLRLPSICICPFLSTSVLLLYVWAASTANKSIGRCLPTGLTFHNFWMLFLEFLSLHFFIRYNLNIANLMCISTCSRNIQKNGMANSTIIGIYGFQSMNLKVLENRPDISRVLRLIFIAISIYLIKIHYLYFQCTGLHYQYINLPDR